MSKGIPENDSHRTPLCVRSQYVGIFRSVSRYSVLSLMAALGAFIDISYMVSMLLIEEIGI